MGLGDDPSPVFSFFLEKNSEVPEKIVLLSTGHITAIPYMQFTSIEVRNKIPIRVKRCHHRA